MESAVPFAFLSAVARPLMTYVDELPKIQSRCLRAALGEDEPDAVDVFLLGAALLGLFAEAGRERPLLLLLDDVHWADEISLRAVLFGLLRLERDPVGAVLTRRDVDVPPLDASGFGWISPARLDATAVAALIAAIRGESPSDGVARQLAELTGGNPLALVELAGSLSREALSGRSNLPEPLPVGDRLLQAYAHRAYLLPLDTQRALLVAAASDERLGPVLQAVSALGGSSIDLDPAERGGLVQIAGDTISFRHPLIRSAVLGSADPVQRRDAHRALARVALLSAEARAWHLAASAAGPHVRAAAALETAAKTAAGRGDPASAAEMWARAAELTPDVERRPELLADAAEAAMTAGHLDRCLFLADAAMREVHDPPIRGRMLVVKAEGEPEPRTAQRIYLEAASLLAPHDGVAAMRALEYAIGAANATLSVDLMRQCIDRARSLERAGEAEFMFLRASLIGRWSAVTGDLAEALPHFDHVLIAIHENQSLRDDPTACGEAAVIAGFFGHVDLVDELVEHALDMARARGAASLVPFLLLCRAEVAMWRADLSRAAALIAESAELSRAMGSEDGYSAMTAYRGLLDVHRGDVAAARDAAGTYERWAKARGITQSRERAPAMRTLAMLDLLDGKPERALLRLLTIAELPVDGRGVRTGPLTVVEDLAEAAVLAGKPDAAEPSVTRLSSYARLSPDPLASALAARCRALLADGDLAAEEFAAALGFHERDPDAFATARTRLCFGEWLRRRGRRVAAREHLYAALDVFDRVDAQPWVQRARVELRASGESIGPRDEARVRLTAQELRTAMTVAEGLTNREAAERLFVSVKTVEFHLGAVFRKLGVRSRTELARHPLIVRARP
jgi:DNA-binding CsgD family transcriptional regulator